MARYDEYCGASLARAFDEVYCLPYEPRLEALEPAVTRVMELGDSAYAAAVAALASRLGSHGCDCATGHSH